MDASAGAHPIHFFDCQDSEQTTMEFVVQKSHLLQTRMLCFDPQYILNGSYQVTG